MSLPPRTEISRSFRVGRLTTVFHWRSSKLPMRRFGGGWNWELGFQAGGRTVIANLLVFSLRFNLDRKDRS